MENLKDFSTKEWQQKLCHTAQTSGDVRTLIFHPHFPKSQAFDSYFVGFCIRKNLPSALSQALSVPAFFAKPDMLDVSSVMGWLAQNPDFSADVAFEIFNGIVLPMESNQYINPWESRLNPHSMYELKKDIKSSRIYHNFAELAVFAPHHAIGLSHLWPETFKSALPYVISGYLPKNIVRLWSFLNNDQKDVFKKVAEENKEKDFIRTIEILSIHAALSELLSSSPPKSSQMRKM